MSIRSSGRPAATLGFQLLTERLRAVFDLFEGLQPLGDAALPRRPRFSAIRPAVFDWQFSPVPSGRVV